MAQPNWDSLVQDSERLRAEDNFGIPQPQRTLAQIQEHARQLRQNAGGVSTLKERRLASNVLGGALDTSALTKKTLDFSIEPAQDELFLEDTWTVEEYMQNMARRNIALTVQARIDEEERQFESFMMQCMDADWAAERAQLLDSVMTTGWERTAHTPQSGGQPMSQSPGPMSQARLSGLFAPSTPGPRQEPERRAGLAESPLSSPYPGADGQPALTPTQTAIVAATERLIDARNLGSDASIDIVKEYRAALSQADNPSEPPHNRMATIWDIVGAQLASLRSAPALAEGSKDRLLLGGTLKYLEACYFDFIRKFVDENRYIAQPGGTGAKSALVRAYLTSASARTGAAGLVPADAGFGWHEVYQCLRSGLWEEAVQAAAQPTLACPGLHHVSSHLQGWLQEWRRGSRCLSDDRAREVAAQCAAAMRQPEVAGNAPLAKVVALVLCTLCGSQRAMSAAFDAVPRLKDTCFTSIEDFLWFRCHAAHAEPATRSGLEEDSSLHQLRQDINMSPPAHYTRNGSRPLQFVAILLMTLQYGRALAFLHLDAMTSQLRDAAAALAIVLHGVGIIDVSNATGLEQGGGIHPTKVVSAYAQAAFGPTGRSQGQIKAPREYLLLLRAAADMAAATSSEDSAPVREAALYTGLHKWLTDTQQFALLDRQLLERFAPSHAGDGVQRRVLSKAARAFEQSDPDGACELYLLAANFGRALEQIDLRLSKKLKALSAAPNGVDPASLQRDIDMLNLRGHEAHDRYGAFLNLAGGSALTHEDRSELERSVREHWQGFQDLLVIRGILQHAALASPGDIDATVRHTRMLSHWLPLSAAQVALCASRAHGLPPYIADLVPAVVMAGARALSKLASSPGLAPAIAEAAKRELEQLKQFASALRRQAPNIALSVLALQEINMLQ